MKIKAEFWPYMLSNVAYLILKISDSFVRQITQWTAQFTVHFHGIWVSISILQQAFYKKLFWTPSSKVRVEGKTIQNINLWNIPWICQDHAVFPEPWLTVYPIQSNTYWNSKITTTGFGPGALVESSWLLDEPIE